MKGAYSIILLFSAISLLGLLAITKIPFVFFKEDYKNSLTISFQLPNASPERVESEITAPLEGILGTIQGITNIKSSSGYNFGNIIIEYEKKINNDKIRFEVASLIRQIYSKLPLGASYPNIIMGNTDISKLKPLMSLQLIGNHSSSTIRKYVETIIKPRLAAIDGLKTVEVHGGESDEWMLTYRPEMMTALDISEDTLINIISQNGNPKNLGWVREKNGLKLSISIDQTSEIFAPESIKITIRGKKIIKLSDLVEVNKVEKRPSSYFRINGQSGVQIVLLSRPNVNQIEVANEITSTLRNLSKEFPSSYGIRVDYNATDFIKSNIRTIAMQLTSSVLLILILSFFFFRHWKASLIIVISLVASYFTCALVFYIVRINLNLSSLHSAVIGTGLCGGNIMLTYAYYQKNQNTQIVSSIFGNGFIMVATFSVILLLPKGSASEVTSFGVFLLTIQFVSFFTCKWLVPSLSEQFGIKKNITAIAIKNETKIIQGLYKKILAKIIKHKSIVRLSGILLFGIPLFLLPEKIDKSSKYGELYNLIIGNAQFSENIRPYLEKSTGGFLRLFAKYVYENAYYRSDEQTALYVNASLPNNSTLEQMDQTLRRIEGELGNYNEIDRFITQVYNGQKGSILVYFKKGYDDGSFPFLIKSKVIELTQETSGIDWNIFGVGQAFSANLLESDTPEYNVVLKGFNHSHLDKITKELHKRLSLNSRVQNIDINRTIGMFRQKELYSYELQTDPRYWVGYNTSQKNIYRYLQRFGFHKQPDLFTFVGNSYDGIILQPTEAFSFDIESLKLLPIPITPHISLKLGDQSSVLKHKTVPTIQKEDQQYLRQLSFEYLGSPNFGDKFLDETLEKLALELPIGYSVKKHSSEWTRPDANKNYWIIGLSLILIFIVAAANFESIRQPFALIASVSLTLIGLFLAFYLTDMDFDQGGFAAFLLAICVSSLPIVIVMNTYNIESKKNQSIPLSNYSMAIGSNMLNSFYFLATIGAALIPYFLFSPNKPFWSALAIGTMGSITICPIILLFFLPVFLIPSPATTKIV